MKLYGKDIISRNRTGEQAAVITFSDDEVCLSRHGIVTMHEIKGGHVWDPPPQGVRTTLFDRIPAHMRHFELIGACIEGAPLKAFDLAFKNAQADRVTFFAALKKHLFANANAQQGFGLGRG